MLPKKNKELNKETDHGKKMGKTSVRRPTMGRHWGSRKERVVTTFCLWTRSGGFTPIIVSRDKSLICKVSWDDWAADFTSSTAREDACKSCLGAVARTWTECTEGYFRPSSATACARSMRLEKDVCSRLRRVVAR